MDYRVSATIAEHGFSDEWADKCLDALMERHPDVGPVVSQSTASGYLTVTIALDATDPWSATTLAQRLLSESFDAIGLPLVDVVDVTTTLVEEAERLSDDRQLVSA